MSKCRILSLDGGGAWALIQVMVLQDLFGNDAKGFDVLRHFDVVAANSGGSLVLGGMLENLKLSEVLQYFMNCDNRRKIFSPSGKWTWQLWNACQGWRLIGPRYSSDVKLTAIEHLLPTCGRRVLGGAADEVARCTDRKPHLLIVGFHFDLERAVFFRSKTTTTPALGTGDESKLTVAEAIHASTNAPINYFDGPARYLSRPDHLPPCHDRYWDGGITGLNNPVLAAVTEAIQLGFARDSIVALSLGTAHVARARRGAVDAAPSFTAGRNRTSLFSILGEMARSVLDDPPDMASFLALLMLGYGGANGNGAQHVVRMNPLIAGVPDGTGTRLVPPGMTMPEFDYLANIDMDAVQQKEVNAIQAFAKLWIAGSARNQPIRMDGDTLAFELGDPTFAAARDHWNRVSADPPAPPVAVTAGPTDAARLTS